MVLVYNEFRSAISQNVVLHQILPIETSPADESQAKPVASRSSTTAQVDFIYEPSREALMTELLPKHIAMQVYRAMPESAASEQWRPVSNSTLPRGWSIR